MIISYSLNRRSLCMTFEISLIPNDGHLQCLFFQIASSSSYLGMNVANHFAVKNFESQITIGYVLGNPKTDTVIMQIGFAIYLPQTAISSKK